MSAALTFRASARHGSRPGSPAVGQYGIARFLMNGALERIEAAREHLVNGEQPERQVQLRSALMILSELRGDLDLPRGGAIAANLDDLYDYMCRRLGGGRLLGAADLQSGIAALDEVSHLLDALQSAWNFMPAEVRERKIDALGTGPLASGQKPRLLPAGPKQPVGVLAESAAGDFRPVN